MRTPMRTSSTAQRSAKRQYHGASGLGACKAGLLFFTLAAAAACKNNHGAAWAESSAPQVRVNQVGYLPGAPKIATVRTDAPAPLAFSVYDANGAAVLSGKTRPFGADAASGDHVQLADFSQLARAGTGYVVRVKEPERGTLESFPFDIRDDLYAKLKYEALAYFYHNRSGIPITMPFAGDARWTRPAGHLSDKAVPCWRDCNYLLDVSGGWYDAGDHGKYVVNGGIAAWTLLNLFERTKYLGSSSADFADGRMSIPERGNGVPDLLDEARYEVEFLLEMQVPEGQPLAGMAHHKIHDHTWSALGREPPTYANNRALHPPSTAATLNLAASAAQAGRMEIPLSNPHHRFWAASYRNNFPPPPPGAVSGGPNSSLQDPQSRKSGLLGCKPQKCFLDHIEAWSVNEVTINWNAPFAWVLAFLDERGKSDFH